jgi:hypothetical protein
MVQLLLLLCKLFRHDVNVIVHAFVIFILFPLASVEIRGEGSFLLIPQVRLAHKYPISPWEMIHPPGGDNPVRI